MAATSPWRSWSSRAGAPRPSWRTPCCASAACATTRWTKRRRASGGSDTASGSCLRPTTSWRWSTCATP
eukprot:1798331-Alexandrium_andersonii.AAC.1